MGVASKADASTGTRHGVSGFCLTVATNQAFATSNVEPFKATKNFALLETQSPYIVEYSTGSGADWNVLSWGQQSGAIWKPFTITNPSSTVRIYTSSTLKTAYDPMSVSFQNKSNHRSMDFHDPKSNRNNVLRLKPPRV